MSIFTSIETLKVCELKRNLRMYFVTVLNSSVNKREKKERRQINNE